MDIQGLLTESAEQEYQAFEKKAGRMASKWERTGLLEGLKGKDKTNMAVLLEQQTKRIVAEANTTGTGGTFSPGQGEQWAGVALPIVRKVFAQIAAKDFVSLQPMTMPSGLVFFLDFKFGDTKAPYTDGDNLYGTLDTLDVDPTGGLYGVGRYTYSINNASASVEQTTGTATSASLAYQEGLLPSDYETVSVDLTGTEFDALGVRAFRILSGSTNVTNQPELTTVSGNVVTFVVASSDLGGVTGEITGSVVYQKQPSDNSRGDFEADSTRSVDTSITIPEIDIDLRSEAVVAKTRKLKAQWTQEYAQDLNAYQNIDAEAEITALLSEYMSMEIDLEILDMLIQDARTTERWSVENNKVWNGTAWTADTSDFYNTQGQWFQTLGTKMQKVSNKIHQKTLRGGANFAVVSPTVATILESIPGYAASTDGDKMDFAMGVQKVGSLNNRFRVYKNPYMTENLILMGYRGNQFLETGASYCPYIPLMMTPLVLDPETFTPKKGVLTRYAKKMLRPEFYGKIFISQIGLL
jgi:hypothetical protein